MNIVIDKELQSRIPPLSESEFTQLEKNILEHGCRDPLVIWKTSEGNVLLDGHNRYAICTKHGLGYQTKAMELESKEQALEWIDKNQIGRRNLHPEAFKLILGRIYNRTKSTHGGNRGNQHTAPKGQNVTLPDTAKELGEQHNVSDRTVKRAGKAEEAVRGSPLEPAVLAGEARLNEAAELATAMREIEPEAKTYTLDEAREKVKPHVAHNSGNNEWYTPPEYIDAARRAMGSIDTDPASSEIANKTVGANIFFTKETNGLAQKWHGNVWMNPPYAQPLISDFSRAITDKFTDGEISQACVLVNNATETQWFQYMLNEACAVCFTRGRVRFLDVHGNPGGAPLQGQAVLYFGDRVDEFTDAFSRFGSVLYV